MPGSVRDGGWRANAVSPARDGERVIVALMGDLGNGPDRGPDVDLVKDRLT
jgi:hypothetical protein